MRPTVFILMFLIFMNATVGLLGAAGFYEAAGVQPDIQTDGSLEDAERNAEQVSPEAGGGGIPGSFVGAVTGLAGSIVPMLRTIVAAPLMFRSLGVPDVITAFVFAPLYLVVTIDVANFITGRFQ
jgi:hypothetical protein